ncbi:MAG: hypothetical protein C0501_28045 [Isosphaera sp.]|nr:hypothetical protein [Isosphaera sp.]
MPTDHPPGADRAEAFVRLFAGAEPEVYRYVFALVPDPDDARDVMQETAAALWRKFGEYDPARPFVPWACRFALTEVHNFRRRRPPAALPLTDAAVAALAADAGDDDPADARLLALAACLDELPEDDRRRLRERYWDRAPVRDAAAAGRNVHTAYKALDRIRRRLLDCVTRRLAREGER